ncbi:MAG: LPS assembly lipoprotein LptE [Pseudomonadota bacterium]
MKHRTNIFALTALFAVSLMVTACGFQPVYGDLNNRGVTTQQQFAQVRIPPIAQREGQILRNHLIDQIYVDGVPREPSYDLRVGLRYAQGAIDIDRDDSVTRTQLTVTAQAVLVDRATNQNLWQGDSRAITTFNVLDSPFATVVSERTAREQALKQIADDLVVRLGAFFTTQGTPVTEQAATPIAPERIDAETAAPQPTVAE